MSRKFVSCCANALVLLFVVKAEVVKEDPIPDPNEFVVVEVAAEVNDVMEYSERFMLKANMDSS